MRVSLSAALSALALAGCASSYAVHQTVPVEPAALTEQDIRAIALASRPTTWKDPSSIIGAQIADPLLCRIHSSNGTTNAPGSACVCIELNAKNSYGGYVGLKREVYEVVGNTLSKVDYGTVGPSTELCPNMKPFPELNGNYIAPKPSRSTRPIPRPAQSMPARQPARS
jgi:hypothetical protein